MLQPDGFPSDSDAATAARAIFSSFGLFDMQVPAQIFGTLEAESCYRGF